MIESKDLDELAADLKAASDKPLPNMAEVIGKSILYLGAVARWMLVEDQSEPPVVPPAPDELPSVIEPDRYTYIKSIDEMVPHSEGEWVVNQYEHIGGQLECQGIDYVKWEDVRHLFPDINSLKITVGDS